MRVGSSYLVRSERQGEVFNVLFALDAERNNVHIVTAYRRPCPSNKGFKILFRCLLKVKADLGKEIVPLCKIDPPKFKILLRLGQPLRDEGRINHSCSELRVRKTVDS